MHVKGTPPNFFFPASAAEPHPKESGSTGTDAAAPRTAAPNVAASRPMPSTSGRQPAYLLRRQLAAGLGLKPQPASKAGTPAGTGTAHLETGPMQAVAESPLTPDMAITKLFLGTPLERMEAQKVLAGRPDAIVGPDCLSMAAEADLWNGRLRRPGF